MLKLSENRPLVFGLWIWSTAVSRVLKMTLSHTQNFAVVTWSCTTWVRCLRRTFTAAPQPIGKSIIFYYTSIQANSASPWTVFTYRTYRWKHSYIDLQIPFPKFITIWIAAYLRFKVKWLRSQHFLHAGRAYLRWWWHRPHVLKSSMIFRVEFGKKLALKYVDDQGKQMFMSTWSTICK